MKPIWIAVLAVATMSTVPAHAQENTLTAPLKSPSGADLGSVTLTGAPGGVLLRIEAKGLPAGWHGIHFHAVGRCDDPKFENAGGHVHEGAIGKHGLLNADRTDAGDLPNIHAGQDGVAEAETFSTLVRLDGSESGIPTLRDADGSAVIIHANPDDYRSQPIGGAGPRIACAVIK